MALSLLSPAVLSGRDGQHLPRFLSRAFFGRYIFTHWSPSDGKLPWLIREWHEKMASILTASAHWMGCNSHGRLDGVWWFQCIRDRAKLHGKVSSSGLGNRKPNCHVDTGDGSILLHTGSHAHLEWVGVILRWGIRLALYSSVYPLSTKTKKLRSHGYFAAFAREYRAIHGLLIG